LYHTILSNPPRYIGKRNPEVKQTRKPVSKKGAEEEQEQETKAKKMIKKVKSDTGS